MATCPTCKTRYPDDVAVCAGDGDALLPDEAMAVADADLAAGQMVGEYRVEGKLGEGGFGAVYGSVHPLIGKAAAIKVLHKQFSSNPQMVSRFIAEARAVNQIRNRNIIDIFSFGTLPDGRQYYVMELLEGMPMDKYLEKRGRLGVEEAVTMLRGVARALDAAHAAGIAHRDLKPENIFLMFEDGVPIPKLLDFGIAKLLGESSAGHKTRTGTPMGTPYYMSPEQCRGRNVDHRTDVYSFGVMLFQTLAGRVPFDGEDMMEILVKHTTASAPRLSEACPDLPAALDPPLLAFLEKDPEKRPSTVGGGLDAVAQAAANAGFDVKVNSHKAREPDSRVNVQVKTGGGLHGADTEGKTIIVEEGGKTMLAAEAAPPLQTRGGAGSIALGVIAVMAVAGVGLAAFFVTGAGRTHEPTVGAAPLAVLSSAPPARATGVTVTPAPLEPSAATAPSTPSSVATAAGGPEAIELTVDADPKVVDVYQGSTKLGTSTGPIKVKRGDSKVRLTFKAAGYAPQEQDVPCTANTVVAVKLKRVIVKKNDLENPFGGP